MPKNKKEKKGKTSLTGAELFDQYYKSVYEDRWPKLKEALKSSSAHIALKNPYNEIELTSEEAFFDYPNLFHASENINEVNNANKDTLPFYFLDGASALAAISLQVEPGDQVLDLCAAPGGKSLILAYALKGEGRLVANDKSTDRRLRLHKVLKSSLPDDIFSTCIKVTGHDASKWCLFEKEAYDKILLDAPCSSEAHVLTSESHLSQWRLNRTKRLAINQWTMLASAWLVLKPGGRMVYSTCSISKLENDDVIEKLLKKFGEEVELSWPKLPFGEKTEFGTIILPDEQAQGPIYMAVMTKKDS